MIRVSFRREKEMSEITIEGITFEIAPEVADLLISISKERDQLQYDLKSQSWLLTNL